MCLHYGQTLKKTVEQPHILKYFQFFFENLFTKFFNGDMLVKSNIVRYNLLYWVLSMLGVESSASLRFCPRLISKGRYRVRPGVSVCLQSWFLFGQATLHSLTRFSGGLRVAYVYGKPGFFVPPRLIPRFYKELRTRARIKCHAFYSNCLYNKEIR
jgi:hypothetical protein